MYLLFVILMVIAALLMCFIVLIQNSKGGGLASGFSSSNAIMGVRKTTDFLEKATWGLAIFMVVMSIATAYVIPSSDVAKEFFSCGKFFLVLHYPAPLFGNFFGQFLLIVYHMLKGNSIKFLNSVFVAGK